MTRIHGGSIPTLTIATAAVCVGLLTVMALTGVPFRQAAASSTLIGVGSLGGACLWFATCRRGMHVLEATGMGIALFSAISAMLLAALAFAGVRLTA